MPYLSAGNQNHMCSILHAATHATDTCVRFPVPDRVFFATDTAEGRNVEADQPHTVEQMAD
jgi:hypothetical protein